MAQPKIGFIGLGLMGAAMVNRLQDKGYDLTITANRSRAPIDAAVARGAVEVGTAREVAAASDIVMLCMDTSASVESRMRGADGVIAGLKADAVVIDFGTSLPASTRTLAGEVAAAGGQYLDGPLGRTPAHAEQGQLNIMSAGDKAAFDKIQPTLKDLGENVYHLGASGAGHTLKLLNNFYNMTCANAMGEAFAMADQAGLARSDVYDVMAAGPGKSAMMDFVKAYAVDKDASMLAFAVKNASKDVGYYNQMCTDAGLKSKMAPCADNAMREAVADGYGERMVSEMVDFYADKFNAS
jgi:2-hydroxy-3-oxopropionate reductase